MKKILLISFVLITSFAFGQAKHKEKFGVYSFEDSVYFKRVPSLYSAGVVHLGIDTVAGSPTFGKLVRKTASASTPTLQQIFNTEVGGSVFTKDDSVLLSGFNWRIFGDAGTVYRF